ncbi:MAG: metallophosphoesterase, partial [Euryarchaeota archaeon]|nr:metallophosphoesterase [Euryarchaeota archaeon]
MLERIVSRLTDRGCLLDPNAAAHIQSQSQPERYLEDRLAQIGELPFVLTLEMLRDLELHMPTGGASLLSDSPLLVSAPAPAPLLTTASPLPGRRPLAADVPTEVRVLKDASMSPTGSGDVRDFVRYFNDRLEAVTKLLRQRREVANAIRIKDAGRAGKEVQLIGLVKEKSRSPSGHRFLTLEDGTGEAEILVGQDKPELAGSFDSLLSDEVIGVVARPTKDGKLLVADQLIRPDVPYTTERPRPEGNLYVGFLGDVHVGSKTFLGKPFRAMLRWLHGDDGSERERAVARSLKYLVFPGDLVDGVGVYPGQREGLEIEDVYKQYESFAQELENLPEHIHLVFVPGNHDASRPNEPQPALTKDIRNLFDRHEKTFVSNPSQFSLHGVNILAYHGYSMVDFATSVPGFRMDQPIPIMKQMLQSRHIAPTYGGKTPISPEEHDFLVIDQVPDLFVTGHVHVAAMDRYKHVTLVNGGTWQAQTDYQRM